MKKNPGRAERRKAAREAARNDGKQYAISRPKQPVGRPSARNSKVGR
jgi:hypothetical protein